MKFLAVALLTTLVSAEAFSQVRYPRNPDYDTYEPRRDTYEPRRDTYEPRRDHDPRYEDYGNYDNYGRTTYRRPLECYYGDMLRGRQLIHSFSFSQECTFALSSVERTGRFCDGRAMYDMRGRLVKKYRHALLCQARLSLFTK